MEPGVAYSPTPAPQDPTPNQPQPTTRPGLSKVAIIVGTVVVLGLIAITGVVKNRKPSSPAETIPTPTTVAAQQVNTPASPTATPKPGWETYTDPADGFSIHYPKEFTLNPYQESTFKGIALAQSKSAASASASAEISLKIIYLANSAKNSKQFAADQAKLENLDTITPSTLQEFSTLELPLKGEWGRGKIIFFEKGSTVYRISYIIAAPLNFVSGYEATINQILASFKIPVPDPSRGK